MKNKPLLFPVPQIPPRFTLETAAAQNREFAQKLYNDFFSFPIEKARTVLETTPAEQWEQAGQHMALSVFHAAAQRVPAYKDFLKKNGIDHKKIKTIGDFEHVPTIDKKSYLQRYPLEDMCWDGHVDRSAIISVSSGSTGKPFLWPRDGRLEMETTYFFELSLDSFLQIAQRKTLIVDCFAMGMYVGGPFFLNATLRIAQKGYPATVATPGNIMGDILRVVQEMSPHYEQVILSGYPPFLKDVIEQGSAMGIDWSRFRTILFPAGEGFSEPWRKAIAHAVGNEDLLTSCLGYYGTADAAVVGVETPWSVYIRQLISRENSADKKIFGQTRLPSLMQYIPSLRYLERVSGEIHLTTANGSIPLIRYNIGDNGGLISHNHVMALSQVQHSDIEREMNICGYQKMWQLPYVYVFGRSDHTAIVYGANVYPENVKAALEVGELTHHCSGRFTMRTVEDRKHNQRLVIHVECNGNIKPTKTLQKKAMTIVTNVLKGINAEYNNASKAVGRRAIPRIILHEYSDEKYFPRRQKQQWRQ